MMLMARWKMAGLILRRGRFSLQSLIKSSRLTDHFWPPNLSFSVVFKETYRVKLLLVPLRLELCLRDACTLGLLGLLPYQVVNYVLAQVVFHALEVQEPNVNPSSR